ncbi:MAG: hypothetical protein PWQ22_1078 [Archaeoglobaceae archaeon]|nr:hypothetical protein [Archaeoglobaceae archaeon]
MNTVLLTAERCLMSDYNGSLFLGFTACAPRSLFKPFLYFRLICPPVPVENGSAKIAPYGTRKIEATLLENGFKENEVKIVPPEKIRKSITEDTRVVGITTNDPLGLGPASTTFSGDKGLVKEESFNVWKFRELLDSLKDTNVKIVVGGPGAWQLEDRYIRKKLGIDVVVIGEGEAVVSDLFKKIVAGEEVPEVVYGEPVEPERIPTIRGASVGGIVEIARGCGRGCRFCMPTMRKFRQIPLEKILEEIKVNCKNGKKFINFHAEDVLRYGARGFEVNKEAVLKLFTAGLNFADSLGLSHFSLASAASSPDTIRGISELLEIPNSEHPWIAGQTGIETGSTRLIENYMPGKAKPFSPQEWCEVVETAFGVCSDNSWVPCATLIIGFPGETEYDVRKTVELVENLREYKSLIVPLFFVPSGPLRSQKGFSAEEMKSYHWELMLECWNHDIHWLRPLAEEYLRKSPVLSRKLLMRFVEWVITKANRRVHEFIKEQIEVEKWR